MQNMSKGRDVMLNVSLYANIEFCLKIEKGQMWLQGRENGVAFQSKWSSCGLQLWADGWRDKGIGDGATEFIYGPPASKLVNPGLIPKADIQMLI